VFPPYQLLIESYLEAQEVVKVERNTVRFSSASPRLSVGVGRQSNRDIVAKDSKVPVARPAPTGKGIE
jgi:hypothetical protein